MIKLKAVFTQLALCVNHEVVKVQISEVFTKFWHEIHVPEWFDTGLRYQVQ